MDFSELEIKSFIDAVKNSNKRAMLARLEKEIHEENQLILKWIAFLLACHNGLFELVRILSVNININEQTDLHYPLVRECFKVNGFKDIRELGTFLQENQYWLYNMSPLMVAAKAGHLDIVKFLLDGGAQVNVCNYHGLTPLIMALQCGHHEIAKLLLQHGADPNVLNMDGISALMHAVEKGYPDLVLLLLEAGADSNIVNQNGFSPLMVAATKGCLSLVQILLDYGALINLKSKNADTAIDLACKQEQLDVVSLLRNAGARVNKVYKVYLAAGTTGSSCSYAVLYDNNYNSMAALVAHSVGSLVGSRYDTINDDFMDWVYNESSDVYDAEMPVEIYVAFEKKDSHLFMRYTHLKEGLLMEKGKFIRILNVWQQIIEKEPMVVELTDDNGIYTFALFDGTKINVE